MRKKFHSSQWGPERLCLVCPDEGSKDPNWHKYNFNSFWQKNNYSRDKAWLWQKLKKDWKLVINFLESVRPSQVMFFFNLQTDLRSDPFTDKYISDVKKINVLSLINFFLLETFLNLNIVRLGQSQSWSINSLSTPPTTTTSQTFQALPGKV